MIQAEKLLLAMAYHSIWGWLMRYCATPPASTDIDLARVRLMGGHGQK